MNQEHKKENKNIIISIIIVLVLVIGVVVFTRNNKNGGDEQANINSVSMDGGKQVITIEAKGGYYPNSIKAKANTPTSLKMVTQGTFDCSSALSIPELGYKSILPQSGETLIDIPAQKPGTRITGICGMGMYNFSIDFN